MQSPSSVIHRWKLGCVAGVRIEVEGSWVLLALLIAYSLALGYFPILHPGLSRPQQWLLGFVGAGLLFLSILAHELSHALVARRFGMRVPSILLFLFGGIAEAEEEPSSPKSELWIAGAGPLASLAISVVGLFATRIAESYDAPEALVAIATYLTSANLLIAAFNLLPAFPLDGGRIFRALMWWWKEDVRAATRISAALGTGIGLLLAAIGLFGMARGGYLSGVWWVLLGFFLRAASRAAVRSWPAPLRHAPHREAA